MPPDDARLRLLHSGEGQSRSDLGVVMGELARRGRDKVTFLAPHSISALGMWLEQLLAESTGKEGKGPLPVAGESVGAPALYGDDRLFIHFRVKGEVDHSLERAVAMLCEAVTRW